MGHFRPIQRGFAMSGYPPEADIGTIGLVLARAREEGTTSAALKCRAAKQRSHSGASLSGTNLALEHKQYSAMTSPFSRLTEIRADLPFHRRLAASTYATLSAISSAAYGPLGTAPLRTIHPASAEITSRAIQDIQPSEIIFGVIHHVPIVPKQYLQRTALQLRSPPRYVDLRYQPDVRMDSSGPLKAAALFHCRPLYRHCSLEWVTRHRRGCNPIR